MVDEEMISLVKNLVDDERFDKFAESYLEIAKSVVISYMFPYAEKTWEDIPEKHHMQTVEIAVYLINRRGTEGETSHSESGTSRSYESSGVPTSMLRGIVPHVGVVS